MAASPRRSFGWIGIAIVVLGVAVAAIGVVYYLHARPKPGEVIDTFTIDGKRQLVVRAEQGGERSYLEMRDGDRVVWQALIPHYVGARGRPGIAWSERAVTARVDRSGQAEVFEVSITDGAKLGGFRLAPDKEPIRTQTDGPITLTDHIRAYEIVGGDDWHRIIAVDLTNGHALWSTELGKAPITSGTVEGGVIRLLQGSAQRELNVFTGRVAPPKSEGIPQ